MANSFQLSTTDQSIQDRMAKPTEVKASETYDTTKDEKTGELKDKTVSKDGVDINKSKAPYLEVGGPLGHMYTELLNQALATHESMASVVSAAGEAAQAEDDTTNIPTGYVAIAAGGARSEVTGDPRGYLHVVDANMTRPEMMNTLNEVAARQAEHPGENIGVAIVGDATVTAESLITHLSRLGIPLAASQGGTFTLARKLLAK